MRLSPILILAALAAGALAIEPPTVMRYEDGLLTVRLERVPLDVVIERLKEETGITFHGELLDQRDVTKSFDGVPLSEALDRMLGRQNFMLRYDAAGHPASVELGGLPLPPPKAGTRPSPQRNRTLRPGQSHG